MYWRIVGEAMGELFVAPSSASSASSSSQQQQQQGSPAGGGGSAAPAASPGVGRGISLNTNVSLLAAGKKMYPAVNAAEHDSSPFWFAVERIVERWFQISEKDETLLRGDLMRAPQSRKDWINETARRLNAEYAAKYTPKLQCMCEAEMRVLSDLGGELPNEDADEDDDDTHQSAGSRSADGSGDDVSSRLDLMMQQRLWDVSIRDTLCCRLQEDVLDSESQVPGCVLAVWDEYAKSRLASSGCPDGVTAETMDDEKSCVWLAFYRAVMRAYAEAGLTASTVTDTASAMAVAVHQKGPPADLAPQALRTLYDAAFASPDLRLKALHDAVPLPIIYHGRPYYQFDLVGTTPAAFIANRDKAARPCCSNPDCLEVEPEEAEKRFQLCAACRSVRYCGVKCQKAHWKAAYRPHKAECKSLVEVRAAADAKARA